MTDQRGLEPRLNNVQLIYNKTFLQCISRSRLDATPFHDNQVRAYF